MLLHCQQECKLVQLLCKSIEILQKIKTTISSVQFSSVAQSCPTLCDLMNHSMPGLPVHHQLPEFTQNHVHQVGDAIQPSHPLSSPSPPAFWYISLQINLKNTLIQKYIIYVSQCCLQHYLQQARYGNNLSVHQQMNG